MPYAKILNVAQDLPILSKFFIVILTIFAPLRVIVYVILFLILVDMITSIYYQMQRCYEKSNVTGNLKRCFRVIESHKLRRSISKMFFYCVALMAFFVFDRYVLKIEPLQSDILASWSVTNLAAILICVTELTSIAANVSKITGNPIFNTIMKIFGKKLNERMEIIIEDDPNCGKDDCNRKEKPLI